MATSHLEVQEVFCYLRPEQIQSLGQSAETLEYNPGDMVYHMGAKANYFYIILDGQITLSLPGKVGTSMMVDQLGKGAMFGRCVSLAMDTFILNAQCSEKARILRFQSDLFKKLMDEDPRMGYVIQTRIAEIYFKRYIESMSKLQAIVMNIPLMKT